MSHYDLLGVPPEATPEQIRAAYRTLVQLFHPDRLINLKPESRTFAEERLKALNQAYAVLSDADKRAAYDVAIGRSRPASARGWRANPAPPPPRSRPPDAAPHRPPDTAPHRPPEPGPAPGRPPEADAARPTSAPDFGASARRTNIDRRRRLAQIDAEIADLTRNVAELEAERRRTFAQSHQQQISAQWRFWLTTVATGLGAIGVLMAGIGIFAQPPGVLNPLAQRTAFVLLVALYEYDAALTIVFASRPAHTPVSFLGTLAYTGRGLLLGWAVGLAGWALWTAAFGSLSGPESLLVLALVVQVAHAAFAWFAVGHILRYASEQRRQFDHVSKPVLQAYEHQLTQLRAQKALIESDTT